MPVWDSTTITRFAQEAEENFVNDYPCILTRIALTITAGTNLYALPDTVRSIRRITWQGTKLDPLGQRNFREVFQSATQQGKPFWYVFNNVGANNIQFFPIPNANINPSGKNLYSDGIPLDVIIEYFSMPDFVNLTIPQYFRRRLIKPYVLMKCFSLENIGQNMKNSQYFSSRWLYLSELYGAFLGEIHGKSRKLCLNGINGSQFFPGSPLLPVAKFGIGVEDGY